MSLGPTFLTTTHSQELDDRIYQNIRDRQERFPEAWSGPNSWVSRFEVGSHYVAPVIARLPNAKNLRVLEVGCGQGQKALCYAPFVDSVVGIDLEESLIDYAKLSLDKMQTKNVSFECVEANHVSKILREDKFDLVVLYAVLEHLTPSERLSLLSTLFDHLADEGMIYVGESPNRIASFDMHTSHLPYVDALENELYIPYLEKFSSREDWHRYVGKFDDRVLGSYRAGRGVSFHEFDLVLGKMGAIGDHIVSDSFSALPRNMYPIRSSEMAIADTVRFNGNSIDQLFSRYWLEGIISKTPVPQSRKNREFTLLPPVIENGFTKGFEAHGLRAYGIKGRDRAVYFKLPPQTHTFQLYVEASSSNLEITREAGETLEVLNMAEIRPATFNNQRYIAIDRVVPPGVHEISVRCESRDGTAVIGDLGVFGAGTVGPLDPRTPMVLSPQNL